jgi:hypothetical protein
MYNAACSWALAGEADSAFFHLQQVATTKGYARLDQLLKDGDLESLHADARWVPIVEAVKHNQENRGHITKQMWKEDVRQLRSLLDYWHVAPYGSTPAAVFDREVNALVERIDGLENDAIVLEIERIVALAGDGHTSFYTTDQPIVDFLYFPMILSQFEEGLFVISASDSLPGVAGLRLVAIGDTPIETVREKLTPLHPPRQRCGGHLHLSGPAAVRQPAPLLGHHAHPVPGHLRIR